MKRELMMMVCGALLSIVSLANATIRRVPAQYSTIQAGINAASSTGDTVMVAPDTYTGTNNRNLTFGGRNITVMSSDGPEVTIIDCQNATRAARFGDTDDNVRFKGFTITHGTPNSSPNWGGGMYLDHATPTISCCIFTGNYGAQGGGAICAAYYSNPTIQNCTFISNNCSYTGGSAGGAIKVYNYANATIINCDFITNTSSQLGGAIDIEWYSNVTIRNCTIIDNTANESGGGIYLGSLSGINVYNTIIKRNFCNYYGGGVYIATTSAVNFTNCTIIENRANSSGGGCYFSAGSPNVKNCIIWDNILDQIFVSYSTLTVSYSDVEGGWSGSTNINSNPMFVDSTNGIYQLTPGSLCIDAGNPETSYNDPENPDSLGRALYPAMGTLRNDMGAYGGPGADDWSTCSYGPPAAPEHLVITINCDSLGCDSLRLIWNAVNGATSYIVYSSDDPDNGFTEDSTGVFNDTTWTAPITDEQRFFYITSENE